MHLCDFLTLSAGQPHEDTQSQYLRIIIGLIRPYLNTAGAKGHSGTIQNLFT